MRIFLQRGLALQVFVDGVEHFNLFGTESEPGRGFATALSGLNQLNDDDCGFGGDGDELEQPLGAFQLAVLDTQALAF